MADSAEQQSKLTQFRNVSGVSDDRARFFLDMSGWNVEAALAALYENGDDDLDELPQAQQEQPHIHPAPASVPTGPAPGSTGHGSSAVHPIPRDPPRFATLGTLRGEESDSSEEEGQAFYAGGSEHGGGQQIIGPKKKNPEGIVSDMFKAAREHGAEVLEPAPSGAGRPAAFQGRAYRLGDSESTPSEVVGSTIQPTARQQQVDMVLKMWKNGFSVDDGPLRDFNDQENKDFLNDIRNGDVPRELIRQAHGGEVNLSLEDHRNEDYIKPVTVVRAFTGEGHRLGCPSDPVTVANESARAMAGTSTTPSAAAASVAEPSMPVDASQPTTNIQIRLADGSKLQSKFNYTHRVSDIRQFIITARPQYATSNFVLLTTFPNAELTDETKTLAAANLLNCLIVQRLK